MREPFRSEPELVVVHSLRCGGSTSTQRLSAVVAVLVDVDVEAVLLDAASRGLVTHDSGPFEGWTLTATGRKVGAEKIAAELEQADARAEVHGAYERFVELNEHTLNVCTDWQVRSREPLELNDHSDPDYDARVLKQLAEVDTQVQPVCARLAACLHRFSHYGPRLATAVHRARRGEPEYVTTNVDSYHSVWFQLHEDLLVTLGIERHG